MRRERKCYGLRGKGYNIGLGLNKSNLLIVIFFYLIVIVESFNEFY